MQATAEHCRLLLGEVDALEWPNALGNLRALIANIPPSITIEQRLLLHGGLGEALSRLAVAAHCARVPEVGHAFVTLARSVSSTDAWQAALTTLLTRFEFVFAERRQQFLPPTSETYALVQQVFALIVDHYADPAFGLRCAAASIGRSLSHTSRTVKQQTGMSFTTLLRRQRIRAAESLLHDGTLSMKEVAHAVGFVDATGFSRAFKVERGQTPKAFRLGPRQHVRD